MKPPCPYWEPNISGKSNWELACCRLASCCWVAPLMAAMWVGEVGMPCPPCDCWPPLGPPVFWGEREWLWGDML